MKFIIKNQHYYLSLASRLYPSSNIYHSHRFHRTPRTPHTLRTSHTFHTTHTHRTSGTTNDNDTEDAESENEVEIEIENPVKVLEDAAQSRIEHNEKLIQRLSIQTPPPIFHQNHMSVKKTRVRLVILKLFPQIFNTHDELLDLFVSVQHSIGITHFLTRALTELDSPSVPSPAFPPFQPQIPMSPIISETSDQNPTFSTHQENSEDGSESTDDDTWNNRPSAFLPSLRLLPMPSHFEPQNNDHVDEDEDQAEQTLQNTRNVQNVQNAQNAQNANELMLQNEAPNEEEQRFTDEDIDHLCALFSVDRELAKSYLIHANSDPDPLASASVLLSLQLM